MESSGIFGIPGTFGERDNKNLFSRMVRAINSLNSTTELLAVELHIADLRHQYEHDNITFDELDKVREVAKKMMEARLEA